MKKSLYVLFMIGAAGFAQAQQQMVKFSADIQNRTSDTIYIQGPKQFVKKIAVGKDGKFTDSFEVTDGMYQFSDGTEYTRLYLKNGYDLTLTTDAKNFDEKLNYTGVGSADNNFFAAKSISDEFVEELISGTMPQEQFDKKLVERYDDLNKLLNKDGISDDFKKLIEPNLKREQEMLKMFYVQNVEATKMKGKPSPTFDYENHKGGKTSLADLKGKYVYIDVWATWCGPCIQEIPHLKRVEEQFHGKNIEFVSISIDAQKDYEKWKKFVTDRQLVGVQLYADKAWESQFVKDYGITGIPRFILLDPNGNIVESNASRPSDPKLVDQLNTLLK